ncbi:ead/Ea22-like family protein [Klebsiella pneumoniae]|uniref:ead/Ea22-like family protein n=1 Tax=Klebsiella pneumoniae TaxID=573 RepID=UPI003F84C7A2
MTDITELAQSLKAAADREMICRDGAQTSEFWERTVTPENILALVEALEKLGKTSKARREAIDRTHNMFVRERNRANAAEEALEKAQQVDEELCRLLPPGVEYMDPPDGGDVTPLEGVRRMVADYRQRIAELESRTVTVKLPQRLQPGADGWDDWYVHSDDEGEYLKFDDVLAMLTAAGIKVEAE